MNITVLYVSELMSGSFALTREQGAVVYEAIVRYLNADQKVVLDFENIENINMPFLNVAIGKLYENFNSEQLNAQLEVKNLPDVTIAKFHMVIQNAKQFYSNRDVYAKVVKDVIHSS